MQLIVRTDPNLRVPGLVLLRRSSSAAAAIATVALLTAGCGGASPHSSSPTSHGTVQNFASAAYRFSSCMRQHGVADFPDPKVSTGGGQQKVAIALPAGLAGSPRFDAAQAACKGILPGAANASPAAQAQQQHARELGVLAFAQCLRSHGVSNFPDPTSQGQLSLQMVQAAGVDLHAPGVFAAAKTCIPASRGQITLAAVQQAVSGG